MAFYTCLLNRLKFLKEKLYSFYRDRTQDVVQKDLLGNNKKKIPVSKKLRSDLCNMQNFMSVIPKSMPFHIMLPPT